MSATAAPLRSEDARRLVDVTPSPTVSSNWRAMLPVLESTTFTLRELRSCDAASLLALLTEEEVTRFISPPPTTVDGFERFIDWTKSERAAGRYVCFGIVPSGLGVAVGLFQVRSMDASFSTAEWGFALGREFWGTGLFIEGAQLVVNFAVDVLNASRLEARAVVNNGRGNGALKKIGAVREGVMRRSFMRNGIAFDQALWAINAEDWILRRLRMDPMLN